MLSSSRGKLLTNTALMFVLVLVQDGREQNAVSEAPHVSFQQQEPFILGIS